MVDNRIFVGIRSLCLGEASETYNFIVSVACLRKHTDYPLDDRGQHRWDVKSYTLEVSTALRKGMSRESAYWRALCQNKIEKQRVNIQRVKHRHQTVRGLRWMVFGVEEECEARSWGNLGGINYWSHAGLYCYVRIGDSIDLILDLV